MDGISTRLNHYSEWNLFPDSQAELRKYLRVGTYMWCRARCIIDISRNPVFERNGLIGYRKRVFHIPSLYKRTRWCGESSRTGDSSLLSFFTSIKSYILIMSKESYGNPTCPYIFIGVWHWDIAPPLGWFWLHHWLDALFVSLELCQLQTGTVMQNTSSSAEVSIGGGIRLSG